MLFSANQRNGNRCTVMSRSMSSGKTRKKSCKVAKQHMLMWNSSCQQKKDDLSWNHQKVVWKKEKKKCFSMATVVLS